MVTNLAAVIKMVLYCGYYSPWQVRRYVYHDVVRLGDLEKLIDCSYIQVFIIIFHKKSYCNKNVRIWYVSNNEIL